MHEMLFSPLFLFSCTLKYEHFQVFSFNNFQNCVTAEKLKGVKTEGENVEWVDSDMKSDQWSNLSRTQRTNVCGETWFASLGMAQDDDDIAVIHDYQVQLQIITRE